MLDCNVVIATFIGDVGCDLTTPLIAMLVVLVGISQEDAKNDTVFECQEINQRVPIFEDKREISTLHVKKYDTGE